MDDISVIGRFGEIANYIEQELYDKKVVVFSKYTETAACMYEMLTNLYEDKSVKRFYNGVGYDELMDNVDKFQNESDCKILVCDYLAGEGRNLQIADCIVHVDLPISPNELEQRIGRLDRIGRDINKDVNSIVFVSEGTIEGELLKIWDSALNIFGESLSGLEIALKELEDAIIEYICHFEEIDFEEFLDRFKRKVDVLKEALEEERYNDANRQLSKRLQSLIENLIKQVDENEGRALSTVMKSWGGIVGLKGEEVYDAQGKGLVRYTRESFSQGSFLKAWYIPPNTNEILKRSNRQNEIQGVFSRNQAIINENIAFFAPGEPIFDSLLKHGINNYQGTSCAVSIQGDKDFTGFIVNWKTSFDVEFILENNIDLSALNYIKAYDINKIETEIFRVAGDELSLEEMQSYLSVSKTRRTHLGRRHGGEYSNIIKFMDYYDRNMWELRVNKAIKETKNIVRNRAKERISRCMNIFKQNYAMEQRAVHTANSYYNKYDEINNKDEIAKALLNGMKNYKLEIDSIVFVQVVKSSEY